MSRCVDCRKYSACKYADPRMPGCLGYRDPDFDACTCGGDAIRTYTMEYTICDGRVWEAVCPDCGRLVMDRNRELLMQRWNNGERD